MKFTRSMFRGLGRTVVLLATISTLNAADPVVSNVQAKQREGSRVVDITYDVTDPDSPTLTVYLKVSADGGATWKGPVEMVSGDIGQHIVPGMGKRLTWDAGKEMPDLYTTKFRYRIGASDQWLGEPGMVLIPAGSFQIGDERWEGPVHTVVLSQFAIDKWEVSIELWARVRNWGNKNGYDLIPGGSFGARHPVHSVNWYDVVKWNNARSEMEGKEPAYYEDHEMSVVYRRGERDPLGVKWNAGFRLPTEAEWEKSARGGVVGKLYPWGTDELSILLANTLESKKGGTTPIGTYGPNGYGTYDMAGNVWEWCWDWHGKYSQEEQFDPRGSPSGSSRVIRGGAWRGAAGCRVFDRLPSHPAERSEEYKLNGFRSVLPSGQP